MKRSGDDAPRPDAAGLLSVSEALSLILASAVVQPAEEVALDQAHRRVLAKDVVARREQPPFPGSAMDGYAVRAADVSEVPARLRVIGTSAAGRPFGGAVGPGEAVRIFTGAPVPSGADAVVIQENTQARGDAVTVNATVAAGRHLRAAGLDFTAGETLLAAGHHLSARDLAVAAAAGLPTVPVRRRPRVAILATGDELVRPGDALGPGQIVASNSYAIAAMSRAFGAEPVDLGIVRDDLADTQRAIRQALDEGADILVTLGGASVGDHDLVQQALVGLGMKLGFWRIAMRPGKPLMHGTLQQARVLGFPGNPVSSMVCALLFLRPLIRASLGDPQAAADPTRPAILGADLAANDRRQDYLRASVQARSAPPVVTPFPRQDSSMMGMFARADALILREAQAPAAKAGDPCRAIILSEWD